MKRFLLTLIVILGACGLASAQPSTVTANKVRNGSDATVAAGNACSVGSIYLRDDTGHEFLCPLGVWVDFGIGGSSGANTALSNLASVSINTSLLAQTLRQAADGRGRR